MTLRRSEAIRFENSSWTCQPKNYAGSPNPSRRVLLALGAAGPPESSCSVRPAALSGTLQLTDPTQMAVPGSNDAYADIPRSEIQGLGAIDGVPVFSPTFERYDNPQTVGKITVREVCKGP